MYLERWGLLAPPLGEALKDISALLFPTGYYTSTRWESAIFGVRRTGVQACKKLPSSLLATKTHDTCHLDFIHESNIVLTNHLLCSTQYMRSKYSIKRK
jgi:hypothetical protein